MRVHFLAIVAVAAGLAIAVAPGMAAAEAGRLRGISPVQKDRYTAGGESFDCLDGTGTIPVDRINDDYCDCVDGSDEPGTAACANGRFYCSNRGHKAEFIASFKVDDGVCDCCDGSDEADKSCANTCKELGAEVRRGLEAQIASVKAGLVTKEAYAKEGAAARAQAEADVVAKEAEADALRPEKDTKQAELDRLEKLESIAEARKKRIEWETREKERKEEEDGGAKDVPVFPTASEDDPLPELPEGAPTHLEENEETRAWRRANGFEDTENLKKEVTAEEMWAIKKKELEARKAARLARQEAAKKAAEEGGDGEGKDGSRRKRKDDDGGVDEDEFDPEDSYFNLEGGDEGLELVPPGTEDDIIAGKDVGAGAVVEESEAVLTTADGEKGVGTASDGVGSGSSASGQEGIVAGGDGDTVAAVVEADPGPTEEEVAMAEAAAVYAALSSSDRSWVDARVTELRGLGKLGLWDLVAAPYRFFAGQPLSDTERVRDDLKYTRDLISKLDREARDLKKKLEHDYGESSEFFALASRCVAMETREYTYEVCPFDKANQKAKSGSSTKLGSWEGWGNDERTVMKFTKGQKCWGGPERSLTVSLECGSEDEVVNVDEPEKCTYTAVLRTPAACRADALANLEAELKAMS